jgi:cell division protein FtsI/penicillin-binding protein 2
MITDRSGRPLAVSVPVKAIWADPKELHDAGGVKIDETHPRIGIDARRQLIQRHIEGIRQRLPARIQGYPIRGCVSSIWRVRLTLTWPTTSKN